MYGTWIIEWSPTLVWRLRECSYIPTSLFLCQPTINPGIDILSYQVVTQLHINTKRHKFQECRSGECVFFCQYDTHALYMYILYKHK